MSYYPSQELKHCPTRSRQRTACQYRLVSSCVTSNQAQAQAQIFCRSPVGRSVGRSVGQSVDRLVVHTACLPSKPTPEPAGRLACRSATVFFLRDRKQGKKSQGQSEEREKRTLACVLASSDLHPCIETWAPTNSALLNSI